METKNKRIKLLHVIGTFFHGGTERLTLDIFSRLPKEIYDITVCCVGNNYLSDVILTFQQAGIKPVVFPQQLGIGLIRALNKFIQQERFHIVHTHHYNGNLYARLAAILAGAPIIMTYQHNWPGEEKERHRLAFRLLNLWTYKNITISEAIRRYDIELVELLPDKVVTVHNGVDTGIFRPPSAEQRSQSRKKLDLPVGTTIVGTAGRLVDWKRIDLFVKAASIVLCSGRVTQFLVVGDGEMHASLVQLARQLNINHHIRFLGWQSDMPSIYKAMDIFCITSDSGGRSLSMYGGEGFGLVSIEAMASGIPVVAVDTEVNREVITEKCGIFCSATPEALAQGLVSLFESPKFRMQLGCNGRARVEQYFDIRHTVANLSDIYLEAMKHCYKQIT